MNILSKLTQFKITSVLITMIIFAILLSGAASSLIGRTIINQNIIDGSTKTLYQQTMSYQNNISKRIIKNELKEAQDFLMSLYSITNAEKVFVIDDKNNIILSSNNFDIGNLLGPSSLLNTTTEHFQHIEELQEKKFNKNECKYIYDDDDSNMVISCSLQISFKESGIFEKTYGRIYIIKNLREEHRLIYNTHLQELLIFSMAVLLVGLITFFLLGQILRENFHLLNQNIKKIQNQEFDDLDEIKGNSEFSYFNRNLIDLAQKLGTSIRDLEEVIQYRTKFIANTSHEIRTPLNGLLGYAEVLRDSNPTSEQKDYIDKIITSGDILYELINKVLDLSKLEAKQMEIELTNKNLKETINNSLSTFSAVMNKKKIKLDFTGCPNMGCIVNTDHFKISQIIHNLISNAIKFTPENEQILVKTIVSNNTLQLIVKDNGIGLTPEEKEKVFSVYAQANSETQRKFGGTGLGLSISKEIITLLGGEITVDSEGRNKGTTFTVTIPIEITKRDLKETHDKEAVSDVSRNTHLLIETEGKILLVDDNKINRNLVCAFLKKSKIEIDQAEDGKQAVEMFEKGKYDLILMDIHMPVMDGVEAIKKIREIEKQQSLKATEIWALTADSYKEQLEENLKAGANKHLSKPVKKAMLIELVYELLTSLKKSG
jgi:signal transduction histidine kinase/CheY-like chemotaxis protein